MVAEEGFNRIQIEAIARNIQKNKSSFYHYFGDLEVFEEALLDHHLSAVKALAIKVQTCENVRPDMVNLFMEYKIDFLFHKQLRINRENPRYRACFEKVYTQFESAFLYQWSDFLGLEEHPRFAQTFLRLISENFLLQITPQTYSYDWLDIYLQELSAMVQHMRPSSEG